MTKYYTFDITYTDDKKEHIEATAFEWVVNKFLYLQFKSEFTKEKPGKYGYKMRYIPIETIKKIDGDFGTAFETEKERKKMELEVDNG